MVAPSATSPPGYRLGVVGFAHMHVNELIARFTELDRVHFVACADTQPRVPSTIDVEGSRRANLRRALAHADRPTGYDDYRQMLDDERLDIVIFCPEVARHADVAEELAARRIHMVTEKPLAADLAGAHRIAAAARAAGVTLMVNWPTTWDPAIRRAKDVIDTGQIGDVWQFKWRNGASLGPLAAGSRHPGDTVVSGTVSDEELASEWWYRADEGGGALLDYCSYGAILASWYLGAHAQSVQGQTANVASGFGTVEDNATLHVRFPHATAVIEATWTTLHSGVPTGPIVYGTRGTVVVDGEQVLVYTHRGGRGPTRVHARERLAGGPATIAEAFLAHIELGEPPHPTLDVPLNLAAMAILDAGIHSARTGAAEPVPSTAGVAA